jgi:hypothetical protein
MMNRDLMQRQMFRNGGGVVPMQDGGEPTFRERIEALSKAAGRSIKGLMEPNRDPYENMNPIQDPSAPMNLSPEEQAARRAQYEIQQGRFTQAEIDQILRNNPEYGDYGSMEGAPSQDPSAPMNLSPEEQAARWVRAQYEIEKEQAARWARAQYEIQQGRFTQAEIDQILRNNPEYGDYGSMEGAPRYNFPTPSGPRRTEDNDPGFIQRILDYARDGYTLSNDTPIRQPVQEPVPEQNYRNGGPVYYMQEGGMAPMGMPPQGMAPQGAMMPEMAQAQQAGMDSAILEQMLAQASQGIGSLDEAEDYEQVMNMMTGTSATIAERRMELADLVGDEDAQQTPDSVLTLVQPVIMMAKTDEGIGGLAQDQMTEAVTGDMAGGIMSTIDMGAQEGPAPVNFRYGGVVEMGFGGNPVTAPSFDRINPYANLLQQTKPQDLDALYGTNLERLLKVIGDPTENNKENSDFRKAQVLFSLAKSAAQFASPKERNMSPAENLARSAGIFIEDAQGIIAEGEKDKKEQNQQMQQIRLAALEGAQGQFSSAQERASDLALESAKYQSALAQKETERQQDISRANVLRSQGTFDEISKEDRMEKSDIRQEARGEKSDISREERAESKKTIDPKDRSILVVTGADGEIQYQSNPTVNTNSDLNALKKQYPGSSISIKEVPKTIETFTPVDLFKFNEETGNIEQKTIGSYEVEAFKRLTEEGWGGSLDGAKASSGGVDRESTLKTELMFNLFPNTSLRVKYENGKTSAEETNYIEGMLGEYLAPQIFFDGEVQRIAPLNGLPESWDKAIKQRQNNELSLPKHWTDSVRLGENERVNAAPTASDASEDQTGNIPLRPGSLTLESLIGDATDIEAAVGFMGKAREWFNKSIQVMSANLFDLPAPNTAEAAEAINTINFLTENWLVAAFPGRDQTTDQLRKNIAARLPTPGNFSEGVQTFKSKIKGTIAALDTGINQIEAMLPAGVTNQAARSKLLGQIDGLREIRMGYIRMYNDLDRRGRSDKELDELEKFMIRRINPLPDSNP